MLTKKKECLSLLELKKLLYLIKNAGAGTGIRLRLMGHMWQTSFHFVGAINDEQVTFVDKLSGVPVKVHNLTLIMQFELDERFQNYQPNFHYGVDAERIEFL